MISQAQIEQFFTDGYLTVDLDINNHLLDNIISDTVKSYPDKVNGTYHHGTRLQDAWRYSDPVKELAMLPQVLDILESLYLRKPMPFQTLNFPIGTEQPLHSDTIHFNSFPGNFVCGVWTALEDVDCNNGPLQYCTGSHLLPEYNMQDVGRGINYVNYKYYEDFIADVVKSRGLVPQLAPLQKGQAIIWHGNLLHGGSPHLDKTRTRHSQATHYYFEGCQYYTPMKSTPDQIWWRNPRWIGHKPSWLDLQRSRLTAWLNGRAGQK